MRMCVGIVSLGLVLVAAPAASEDAADPPADPPKKWEASIALGGSLRSGDENRYSGNADGMLKRLWDADTLTWTAFGDYGKTGGDRDVEDFGTGLDWRHAFNGRFFWLSTVSADHDAVQGRNLRLQASTGPGYRLWRASEDRYFDVSTGLGYRHEEFRRDEPDNDLFDWRVGYEYKDKIGEIVEILHKTNVFTPLNDIENFLAQSELTLSVPLVYGIHFRNSARYEYVNEPADDKENSNFWLTIGLEYRL
jgi:putative salt-induced outer membrane protein YdiY